MTRRLNLKKVPQWTPIWIEWEDATGGDNSWEEVEGEFTLTTCYSCGQLLASDDQQVTLALSRNHGLISGYISIPMAIITDMRILK